MRRRLNLSRAIASEAHLDEMGKNPILALAIEPATVVDRERLDSALKRFIAEDPTLRVRTDRETKQVIVAGMSERQLQSVVAGLTDVESVIGVMRVIHKVMFSRPAEGEVRFVRQSGARGQFAHAKIPTEFEGDVAAHSGSQARRFANRSSGAG